VVVWALPTGSATSCNRQPSESDVVHDHIRLREHQIVAITCMIVGMGTRHVQHLGTTQSGQTVGGSSGSGELGSGWGSTEMISNGCTDPNGKVLIKRISKHLLSALLAGLSGSGSRHRTPSYRPVVPPHSRSGHGQQLHDLLCGSGMRRRTAATHADTKALELLADCALMNARLGTDLPMNLMTQT
jgi:hypothetical protein